MRTEVRAVTLSTNGAEDSKLEGDGKLAYDVTKKGLKKGISTRIDKSIEGLHSIEPHASSPFGSVGKISGGVAFFTEMGQIVTDHYVAENDKVIDECDSGLREVQRYKDSSEQGCAYAWDEDW